MIVVRFKVQCQPNKVDQVRAVFEEVIGPSRKVNDVLSFDIGSDLSDSNSFIATEVFKDQQALDRQEALPEVAKVFGVLMESLAGPPEATIYHVSKAET